MSDPIIRELLRRIDVLERRLGDLAGAESGATPLSSATPAALGAAGAAGSSSAAARGDHVHIRPTPAEIGAVDAATGTMSADSYPASAQAGVMRRISDVIGSAAITDHFRSGSLPSGFSWAGSPFGGAPSPSIAADYLIAYPSGSTRYFLARSVSTSLNRAFSTRLAPAHNASIGIRQDDGTDNNYVECSFLDIGSGQMKIRFRQRSGGGAIATYDGATTMHGLLYTLKLWNYGAGSLAFYLVDETGISILLNGFAIGWTPARIGLAINQEQIGGPVACDWIAHDFS